MRSCARVLVLTLSVLEITHGELKNLRPLKGILNDFGGPRNVTEGKGDGMVPQSQPDPDFREGSVAVTRVENSIEAGLRDSVHQQNQQNRRPAGDELDLSSLFLSAFRRAEKEAERVSCVGRAMIEATKQQAAWIDLPIHETLHELTKMKIDQAMCEKILRSAGCEDLKKPEPCSEAEPYRRIDGSCNNLNNPSWGRSMTPFVRYHYPVYENGIDAMRGDGRTGLNYLPSPRSVSSRLQGIRGNSPLRNITLMVMQFGQFLDHDITFTAETQIKNDGGRPSSPTESVFGRDLKNSFRHMRGCRSHFEEESDLGMVSLECCPNGNLGNAFNLTDCRPIDVRGDPLFKEENRTCMRFVRSLIASKGCQFGPREQVNQVTSFIDASAVYGSAENVAQVLRKEEEGRLRKTKKGNLLPEKCCEDGSFTCFKAGDSRVNEQPGLTSMHTLWLRVHEHIAYEFAKQNPHWDDETLYQETRRVVAALIQQTTYREFLPLVLGPQAMDEADLHLLPKGPGTTYDPTVDSSIANVFATAAFRFGHTLVNDALGGAGGVSVPLVGNFENAEALYQHSSRPSAILEGLASSMSQAPDSSLVKTLTNRLFALPERPIGLDLMSLNIQRGRDHGLPPYNAWRRACLLQTFTSFGNMSEAMPRKVIQAFKNVYSDVDEIDLFPAALSEFPVNGGLVGPTFACLLGQQFSSLKKGDRFFFQNAMQPKPFSIEQLKSISELSLASIICHHSDTESLQPNVFMTTNVRGNGARPCSTYPRLRSKLWREEQPINEGNRCYGTGLVEGQANWDHWCTLNCFHNPPYCPYMLCYCPSLMS